MEAITGEEWGHAGGCMLRIGVGKLHHSQHLCPIVLLSVAERVELLFQDGGHSLCVPVSFGVTGRQQTCLYLQFRE